MDINTTTPINDAISKSLLVSLSEDREEPHVSQEANNSDSVKAEKRFQFLVTLCAALGGMQAGITLGWTSPILPYLTSAESFLPELSKDQISWITSLLALGAIVGAMPTGKIADRIGRKWAIFLTAVPFAICWLTLFTIRNINSIYIARFIGGIGAGAACVLVPVYVGEIAQPSIRGALGALFPLFFSLGIMFSYVAGAYCSYAIFNLACCAILVPFVLGVPFMPESPMWLVQKNRKIQAIKVLTILRGPHYNATEEIAVLEDDVNRMENLSGGFKDLVGTKAGRKAAVTCVGLMFFQQLCGIDAVLFYTVNIFQEANSTIDPFLATIIIGFTEVIMTIFVAIVIDRFGRKPLLIISGTMMTICLSVLGYYFKLKDGGNDMSTFGWLPLTSLAFFNIVFSIGYGSVPFTIISEIFPPETKGVASSMSIVVHWSLVFAITKLFPIMEYRMGQAVTFWTFSCFTAASAVFSYFVVPETKGKTLQEIQSKLKRKQKSKTKCEVEPA
ncbi:PREDICTED: facilitated trehalose transporter Tret1-like [Acromyrmex echinatior]|uniref:Sugar transporter ERD6-like 8 n=1 Tax=Acromyrmex echinatior TaxID=103372 RepID=F4W7K1_ACREC|nr:PREDICTED: facilitated trehalose transporter Tret1-like [Acromyrmex echinatior]EGI69874.1 Sugar transporter ERD6-like 8 [Acromyrmex echinatior]